MDEAEIPLFLALSKAREVNSTPITQLLCTEIPVMAAMETDYTTKTYFKALPLARY